MSTSDEPIHVDPIHVEPILIPQKKGFLKKLGAGSLAISIIFHVVLVAVGVFIVVANIPPEKEKEVDFRARGGGGGTPASSSQKKMQTAMSKQMPMNRVAASGVASSFVLPEPSNSGAMSALGAMGGGTGGLGGPGSGGGSGAGVGTGTGTVAHSRTSAEPSGPSRNSRRMAALELSDST